MTDHPLPPPSSLLGPRDPEAPITLVMRPELARALADLVERALLELELPPQGLEAQAACFVIMHVRTGEPRP